MSRIPYMQPGVPQHQIGQATVDFVQKEISPVICAGLENLLLSKPENPIAAFATYLKAHNPKKPLKERSVTVAEHGAVPLRYEPRGPSFPVYLQAAHAPIFTMVSPSLSDVQSVCSYIKEHAVADAVAFVPFLTSEVIYIREIPYSGNLVSKLSSSASFSVKVKQAADLLLEVLLEDASNKCMLLEDVFRTAAERSQLQYDVQIFQRKHEKCFGIGSLEFLNEFHQYLHSVFCGAAKQQAQRSLTTAVVLVAFNENAVNYANRISLIPTLYWMNLDDCQRKERNKRAAAVGESDHLKVSMDANLTVVGKHEKLLKRRKQRFDQRRKFLRQFGDSYPEDIKEVEKERENRHEQQLAKYVQLVQKEMQTACVKIQAMLRGALIRNSSPMKKKHLDCHTLFEKTMSFSSSASQSRVDFDGEYPLLRMLMHELISLNEEVLTVDRPTQPKPPKTFSRIKQNLVRVPKVYEGDISSEDEDFEEVVFATKPAPLTAQQMKCNPMFVLSKAMEILGCSHFEFLAEVLEHYREVPAVIRRGYHTVEEITVIVAYSAYTILLHRHASDVNNEADGFQKWCHIHLQPHLQHFMHPNFIATATRNGVIPFVDPSGPPLEDVKDFFFVQKSHSASWFRTWDLFCPEEHLVTDISGEVKTPVSNFPIYITSDALNTTEWKHAIGSIFQYQEEGFDALTWCCTTPAPLLYANETPVTAHSYVSHQVESIEGYGGGSALQLVNSHFTIVKPPPAPSSVSGSEHDLKGGPMRRQKTIAPQPPLSHKDSVNPRRPSDSPPAEKIKEPYVIATNGVTSEDQLDFTASSVNPQQHQLVGFMSTSLPKISPRYTECAMLLELNWFLWEQKIVSKLVEEVDLIDGLLPRCLKFVSGDVKELQKNLSLKLFEAIRVVKSKLPKGTAAPLLTSPNHLGRRSSLRFSTQDTSLGVRSEDSRVSEVKAPRAPTHRASGRRITRQSSTSSHNPTAGDRLGREGSMCSNQQKEKEDKTVAVDPESGLAVSANDAIESFQSMASSVMNDMLADDILPDKTFRFCRAQLVSGFGSLSYQRWQELAIMIEESLSVASRKKEGSPLEPRNSNASFTSAMNSTLVLSLGNLGTQFHVVALACAIYGGFHPEMVSKPPQVKRVEETGEESKSATMPPTPNNKSPTTPPLQPKDETEEGGEGKNAPPQKTSAVTVEKGGEVSEVLSVASTPNNSFRQAQSASLPGDDDHNDKSFGSQIKSVGSTRSARSTVVRAPVIHKLFDILSNIAPQESVEVAIGAVESILACSPVLRRYHQVILSICANVTVSRPIIRTMSGLSNTSAPSSPQTPEAMTSNTPQPLSQQQRQQCGSMSVLYTLIGFGVEDLYQVESMNQNVLSTSLPANASPSSLTPTSTIGQKNSSKTGATGDNDSTSASLKSETTTSKEKSKKPSEMKEKEKFPPCVVIRAVCLVEEYVLVFLYYFYRFYYLQQKKKGKGEEGGEEDATLGGSFTNGFIGYDTRGFSNFVMGNAALKDWLWNLDPWEHDVRVSPDISHVQYTAEPFRRRDYGTKSKVFV